MIDLLKSNIRLVALVVIVVVLLVVDIMFMMQWRTVMDDQTTLEKGMNDAERLLVVTSTQYNLDDLRNEEAGLVGGPEFPTAFPIVDMSLFLADGASYSHVTLDKVLPPEPIGTKNIGGKDYPAYETKVTVTGGLTQIVLFLKYLEGGAFTSLMIQDVSCTSGGDVWEAMFTVVVISQR